MKKLIYAADDEENIRNLVKIFLEKEGFEVETFENGELLIDAFKKRPSDLVILDIMMPKADGYSICAAIRQFSAVPIIMLTARDADDDYVSGITSGADDYFKKPFSPMELVMRVRAIFRRIDMDKENGGAGIALTFGDLRIDQKLKKAYCNEAELPLTPNEYQLLAYLIKNSERAIPRLELLQKIWGFEVEVETRVADDTVKRLRKKLADSKVLVDTVWGFGFRLREKENDEVGI